MSGWFSLMSLVSSVSQGVQVSGSSLGHSGLINGDNSWNERIIF